FLRRFADDPLLSRSAKHLRGLRPVRTATVAQALLRAVCGQLIDSKTARNLERRVIRALAPRDENGCCEPPSTAALGAVAPAELLAPYGEWAGLASVYLLMGSSRGLIPLPAARAA